VESHDPRGPAEPAPAAHESWLQRLRLWNAVVTRAGLALSLDLSSGLQYEWDAAAGYARAVEQADPTRRLPTVDAATLAAWRNAFVDEHGSTLSDPRDQERLRAWLATALGRQGLPGALRTQWSEYLKRAVVARFTSWFQAAGFSAPDLFGAPIDA